MASVNDAVDDSAPVTMGMMRVTAGELRAEMRVTAGELRAEMRATTDALRVEMNARFDEIRLLIRSNATGVELIAPIIPDGGVVVENNSVYAHASRALLRHKVRNVRVISRLRSSKKHM